MVFLVLVIIGLAVITFNIMLKEKFAILTSPVKLATGVVAPVKQVTTSAIKTTTSKPLIINVKQEELAKYIPRGLWKDINSGNKPRGAGNKAISNKFINLTIMKELKDVDRFRFAVRKAIDEKFDTIGFQIIDNQVMLFLGNYNKNGYKYDKYGIETDKKDCYNQPFGSTFGCKYTNNVYSTKSPSNK